MDSIKRIGDLLNKQKLFTTDLPMKTKNQTNLDRFEDLNFLKNESKHAAFARLMKKQIRQMRHGERLPAVRDLMHRFKISQSTIDHALHELETRNLITRRWGSGVYINRLRPRQPAHHTVGIVVSNIVDPFCACLVRGIERKLAASNYNAILCNGHHHFQAELETIHALREKIDGVIINPTTGNVHNPDYVRYFSDLVQSREFPFLLVDIMIPGVNAHFVGFDNFNAFSDMARRLTGSKMRFSRILYLGALGSIIGAERINGFRTGLKEHHISEESLKIINIPLPVSDIPLSANDLRRKPPVLIVAGSPLILPKLLAFCSENNLRIPENVVVAGVLEENFREYINAPVLGWIKPSVRLGELAAQTIRTIIAGKPVRQITKIAMERFVPESLRRLI